MCGIFGVCSCEDGDEASKLTFFGLNALQHRGQEGVGIAVSTGKDMLYQKYQGMVSHVFREDGLSKLSGNMAVGHVRYSTSGDKGGTSNIQPYLIHTRDGPILIAHNGELTEANKLRQRVLDSGKNYFTTSDTETIIHIMYEKEVESRAGDGQKPDLIDRIRHFMQVAEGVYSLIIVSLDAMYAVRDSVGVRPLCFGKTTSKNGGESYLISSESCAISTVSAEYIREVLPGEIVKFTPTTNLFSANKGGTESEKSYVSVESFQGCVPAAKSYLDAFEFVYFARPDTILQGAYVHDVRKALGRELWKENCDQFSDGSEENGLDYVVMGVPDSATPMAIGFSNESGLIYDEGFTKNRQIDRTFIAPAQSMRRSAVKSKFNPLPCNVKGKKLILIDDSIVRGTTITYLVKILRIAGAKEIHIIVGSPPIKYPHYYGIDMKTHEELITNRYDSIDDMSNVIGCDSLNYLSEKGLLKVLHKYTKDSYYPEMAKSFYTGCWSGKYPLKMDITLE